MLEQLVAVQRWIYSSLSGELSAFAATRDWLALANVLPVGIFFGAVHALTPGHGKAILASYLVSSRFATLRATAIAAVQAATHVGSAVVLALLAIPLVTRTLGGVGRAPSLEFLSRGLLMVIGLWLVIRAFRGPNHQHREGLAVGFVAGLVPCPLTLFAMFYALGRGVPEAGLTFALAMMLGVAATLCAVAILTVLARSFVERVITRHGTSLRTFGRVLDGLAGGLLIALGGYELWW